MADPDGIEGFRRQLFSSLYRLADGLDEERIDTESLDREFKGAIATALKGLSPVEMALAYLDWLSHLALSPGKQIRLAQSLLRKLAVLGIFSLQSLLDAGADGPEKPPAQFSSDHWKKWPFAVLVQGHLLARSWLREATGHVEGVTAKHQQIVEFLGQQVVEALSPANALLTNPDVLALTVEERGRNLARGLKFLVRDLGPAQLASGKAPGAFTVGENVAVTPGKVIYQNDLIELIQYRPATATVSTEPVLIVPPWIMKYYILDLSPKNSMVKYLVEQGKTVFLVSWKNPTEEDRDVAFLDYLSMGFFKALDAVGAVCPGHRVNAVGYCIGGTLLGIGAARMARDDDDRLNSVSLFASQLDFSEAGEIARFISESQISFLDKLMWKQGFLGIDNMGQSFAFLRPGDLVYGPLVDRYLKGNEATPNDLMSWNADGTRMPYRMHSEYLNALYLNNELARNRFAVDGRPVSLRDITVPLFNLGTETDHVAPWESVYKINFLTSSEVTCCLTSGGHNAGVISGPQHPRRRYRVATRAPGDKYIDLESWQVQNEPVPGSWWPAWNAWLDARSTGRRKPPAMGAARKGYKVLRDAPGNYVLG
jgi:polyhydroxyalkanoate synthase